jgi:hypothetical protein
MQTAGAERLPQSFWEVSVRSVPYTSVLYDDER